MPSTITFAPDLGVVVVQRSGVVPTSEIVDSLRSALDLAHEHGTAGVLIDSSAARWAPGTVQQFTIVHALKDLGDERPYRLALVMPSDPEVAAWVQPFESIVREEDVQMRLFADRDAALGWLRG